MATAILKGSSDEKQDYDHSWEKGLCKNKSTDQPYSSYSQAVIMGNGVIYDTKNIIPDKSSVTLHTQDPSSLAKQTEVPSSTQEKNEPKKKKKKKQAKSSTVVVERGPTSSVTSKDPTPILDAAGKRAAKKASKKAAQNGQDKTSSKASAEETTLSLSNASAKENALAVNPSELKRIRRVSRSSKGKGFHSTVGNAPAQSHTPPPSIEQQCEQALRQRLSALISVKRQISNADDKAVLNLVFPNEWDLRLLEHRQHDCNGLIRRTRSILPKGANLGKDNSDTAQSELNELEVKKLTGDLLELSKDCKIIQEALNKTMLDRNVQSTLQGMLQQNKAARNTYQLILSQQLTLINVASVCLEVIDRNQTPNPVKTTDIGKTEKSSQITDDFKSQTELGANLCWCLNAMAEIRTLACFIEKDILKSFDTLKNLDYEIIKQYQIHLEKCIRSYQYSCNQAAKHEDYEEKKRALNNILQSQLTIFTCFNGMPLPYDSQYASFTKCQIVEIIKVNYDICIIYFITSNLAMLPEALRALDNGLTCLQQCSPNCTSVAVKPDTGMEILPTHFDFFSSKLTFTKSYMNDVIQKFDAQLVPKAEFESDEVRQQALLHQAIITAISASFKSGFFKWMDEKKEHRHDEKEAKKIEEQKATLQQKIEAHIKDTEVMYQSIEKERDMAEQSTLKLLTEIKDTKNWNWDVENLIANIKSHGLASDKVSTHLASIKETLPTAQQEIQNASGEINHECNEEEQHQSLANVIRLQNVYQTYEQSRKALLETKNKCKNIEIDIERRTLKSATTADIITEIKQALNLLTIEFEKQNKQFEELKQKLEYEANQRAALVFQELLKESEQKSRTNKPVLPYPQPNPPEIDDDYSTDTATTIEFTKPQDPTKGPNLIGDATELITIEQLTILANQKKWEDLPALLTKMLCQQSKSIQNFDELSKVIVLIKESITKIDSEQHTDCNIIIQLHICIIDYIFETSFNLLTQLISCNLFIIQYQNKLDGYLERTLTDAPSTIEDKKAAGLIKLLPDLCSNLKWLDTSGLPHMTNSLTSIAKLNVTTSTEAEAEATEIKSCHNILTTKVGSMKKTLEHAKLWQCLNFEELYRKRGACIKQIPKMKRDNRKKHSAQNPPLVSRKDIQKAETTNQTINGFINKLSTVLESTQQ